MNETQTQNQDRNGGVRSAQQQPPGMDRYSGIGYGTIPQQTASLAARLVETWGARAVDEEGTRTVTPAELVQQSCDTADLLFREFNKRHWIEASQNKT